MFFQLNRTKSSSSIAPSGLVPQQDEPKRTTLPGFHRSQAHAADAVNKIKHAAITLLKLVVYMAVCVPIMMALEPGWSFIDSMYFGMATMSTVGYGDLSPSSVGSRVFAVFMIIFGIVFVFSCTPAHLHTLVHASTP